MRSCDICGKEDIDIEIYENISNLYCHGERTFAMDDFPNLNSIRDICHKCLKKIDKYIEHLIDECG